MGRTEDVVGREVELAELRGFLTAIGEGVAAVIVEGEPGIGKTTLWQAAAREAGTMGHTVLRSRPAESEAKVSFTTLGDLFERMEEDDLDRLPTPQRHALAVALFREEGNGRPLERRAVSVATLSVVRRLAAGTPVIFALDDAQWIDEASADVLSFIARRLTREPVGFLLTARAGGREPLSLSSALRERTSRIPVGPMDARSLARVVADRLGHELPRATLLRLHQASEGNPFVAIEIARALGPRDRLLPDAPLPVPNDVRALVRSRTADLSPAARGVLLVASALSRPTAELVIEAVGASGEAGLDEAERVGILQREERHIAFSHPLFASGIQAEASPGELRGLHGRLAEVAIDPEARARHLALHVEGSDERVAATLDEAADLALARGAPGSAAELGELAIRLTPTEDVEAIHRRREQAANHHAVAGDTRMARALMEQVIDHRQPGPDRARALIGLGDLTTESEGAAAAERLFREAAAEAGGNAQVLASAEAGLSFALVFSGRAAAARETLCGLPTPEIGGWTPAAVKAATLRRLIEAVAQSSGSGPATELEPPRAEQPVAVWQSARIFDAALAMLEGDLSGAGAILRPLYERASEEGDERSLPTLLIYLILLGVQTGDLGEAARFANEACLIAAQTDQRARLAGALSCAAVVEAMMGREVAACSAAEEALSLVGREEPFPSVRSRWAMGIVDLERGDPEGARKHHQEAIEILAGTDIVEPSLWGLGRFLPDAVESFVTTGDLEGAEVISADLSARAKVFPRPWTLAVSARCRGIIAAARGDTATASETFADAVERHQLLDEPYELARTWLAQGIVDRRAKRRNEARAALGQARALFEEIGAEGWARRSSLELERTGMRTPTPEGLTPTELQVAQLVASGQTNREVADALFLSVRTVETNLTRVYRKLGLRSRTELAAHLPTERASN